MSTGKRVRKMSNRNIPKIRFKEFINNWNNYKLGQLGTFKSGIGFSDSQQGGTEGIPFFKVSDMNNIGNETEMRNANNYVTQEQIMKNSWKVINETPAIIFAKVGAALMLNRKRLVTRPFLIDNNTMSYSFDESWDKDFGLTLFQTINLPKYAQIGALPSYNASDIAMIKVNVPDVQEQSAIGSLFRTLDDLLSSYKNNLANYQSLKETMLSKMFPKVGHTVPEIRLDGFEGEWENSKISDYVYLLNGRAFKQDELLNEGKYRVVRVGNFNTNEKWYYSNLELEENKYANKNDLLYLWATNFGPEIWKEEKIIFHYHIWKLEFDRSIIDRNYLYYWLEKDKKRIQQNTNGSTMVHVTKSMMENREFKFPMFREQQAIGSYFSNLDNLIVAHQDKISQLETLKKKLLQDMFL